MNLEAVLLTGGGSTRMGIDKAMMEVGGTSLAARTAAALRLAVEQVTVLGREPLEGCQFLADQEDQAGPLSALSRFEPRAELVFVASCDMPHFRSNVVELLAGALGTPDDAAVTVRAGIRQPTCALYRRRAFSKIPVAMAAERRSLMAWLDQLQVVEVDEGTMKGAGLDPIHFASFNTPSELARIESEWERFSEAQVPPPAPGE